MRNRVLGKHGFEPFPERLEQQAIKQGTKAAPADTGIAEPLLHGNAKAKQELALKMNAEAKMQAEMDKTIKDREFKKAQEEKEFAELLAQEEADKIKAATEAAKEKSEKI
jgi:hypothetical protein